MSWNPEKELNVLVHVYRSSTLEIVQRVEEMTRAGRSTSHARAALEEVRSILKELDEFADEWIEQNIPLAYRRGWDEAFQSTLYATPEGLGAELNYAEFAKINRQAVEVVAYNLRDGLHGATQMVGRQATDIFRHVGLMATQQRLITGEAVADTTAQMKERFVRQGVTAFQDKAGRMWSLDAYCEMVARTTTREATTLGTMNRALAGGYDLIIVSEHHPTCEKCAPIQGKVFCLNGKTTGYPRWQDYVPVHPNCRHTISVYQPKFDDEAERRKEFSNTSLTKDPRSDAEKNAYRATQDAKRKTRDLRDQYKRYRARLGDKAGTVQNFAKAKTVGGAKWEDMQKKYRGAESVVRATIENYDKSFISFPDGSRMNLSPAPTRQIKSEQFVRDCLKMAEDLGADFSNIKIINVQGFDVSSPDTNGFIFITDPEDRIFLLASDIEKAAKEAKAGLTNLYRGLGLTDKLKTIDRLDKLEEFTKKTLIHELGHIKTKHVTGNYLVYNYDDWVKIGLEDYMQEVGKIQGRLNARVLGEWIAEDYRLMLDPDSPYPHAYAYSFDLQNPAAAAARRKMLGGVLK
ncbi:MAG: phage minor capsid protein [Bacillota bacterium]